MTRQADPVPPEPIGAYQLGQCGKGRRVAYRAQIPACAAGAGDPAITAHFVLARYRRPSEPPRRHAGNERPLNRWCSRKLLPFTLLSSAGARHQGDCDDRR